MLSEYALLYTVILAVNKMLLVLRLLSNMPNEVGNVLSSAG